MISTTKLRTNELVPFGSALAVGHAQVKKRSNELTRTTGLTRLFEARWREATAPRWEKSGTSTPTVPAFAETAMADRRLQRPFVAGVAFCRDASSTRPGAHLVDEIQKELEGVCGWSLILWIRPERLRGRVEATVEGGTDG